MHRPRRMGRARWWGESTTKTHHIKKFSKCSDPQSKKKKKCITTIAEHRQPAMVKPRLRGWSRWIGGYQIARIQEPRSKPLTPPVLPPKFMRNWTKVIKMAALTFSSTLVGLACSYGKKEEVEDESISQFLKYIVYR
jgi:hypothetical protein